MKFCNVPQFARVLWLDVVDAQVKPGQLQCLGVSNLEVTLLGLNRKPEGTQALEGFHFQALRHPISAIVSGRRERK